MINFTVSLLYNTVIKGYARGAKFFLLRNPHYQALIDHFTTHVGAMLEIDCFFILQYCELVYARCAKLFC